MVGAAGVHLTLYLGLDFLYLLAASARLVVLYAVYEFLLKLEKLFLVPIVTVVDKRGFAVYFEVKFVGLRVFGEEGGQVYAVCGVV